MSGNTQAGIKIYTWKDEPFSFGGKGRYIGTEIQEYERIDLGKGFFGLLVRNPYKKPFHMVDEISGALVGSAPTRLAVIKRVRKDVGEGEEEVMRGQQEEFKGVLQGIPMMENKDFFIAFEGPVR